MKAVLEMEDVKDISEFLMKKEHDRILREKKMDMVVASFMNNQISRDDSEMLLRRFIQTGLTFGHYTKKEIDGLDRRRDHRRYIQFFSEIRRGTQEELDTFRQFIKVCGEYDLGIHYRDTGVDNSGCIVIKEVHGKPDYGITIMNSLSPIGVEGFIEIKNCPSDYFQTFKKHDIDQYASTPSCFMLCAWKDKGVIKKYYLYSPETLTYLSNIDASIYDGFMGNKPSIRCWKPETKAILPSDTTFKFLEKEKGLKIITIYENL